MLNFEQWIDRTNTGAVKWDYLQELYGSSDLLPMWVADMDFPSPEGIQEALAERIKHPLFGYTAPAVSLFPVIQSWLEQRHGWSIDKESIAFSPGVVTAIGTAIQAFTEPGDNVLIQSPVYTPFFDMIKNNGRNAVNSRLKLVNSRFEIDFADFEDKLKEGVKLFILCSPHNPGGRVWTKEELLTIGSLCRSYGTIIISDEIHADLYYPHARHMPIASLSPDLARQTVTLMAPSKTFNIAGLQASLIISENPDHREAIQKVQAMNGFHGLNLLSLTAMEAAYRSGGDWLGALLEYVWENIRIACDYIQSEIPGVTCMKPDASYLLWIDCRSLGLSDTDIQNALVKKGKLALEPGTKYGPGGEGFVRMNVGCPREILMDGLERFKRSFT